MALRFPVTTLPRSLLFGYAKDGVAVQDCNADLDFRDLAIEVMRHEPLAQHFQTMNPLLGRALRSNC